MVKKLVRHTSNSLSELFRYIQNSPRMYLGLFCRQIYCRSWILLRIHYGFHVYTLNCWNLWWKSTAKSRSTCTVIYRVKSVANVPYAPLWYVHTRQICSRIFYYCPILSNWGLQKCVHILQNQSHSYVWKGFPLADIFTTELLYVNTLL